LSKTVKRQSSKKKRRPGRPGIADATPTERLKGIDAPESKTPGGVAATARLRELVEGRVVGLDFAPPLRGRVDDMWGRLLARAFVRGVDVGQRLLDEGHAVVLEPR